MCVEVSNNLAAFVALLNKIVKELCKNVSTQRSVSNCVNISNREYDNSFSSSRGISKNKRKQSTRTNISDAMSDNDKLASVLVDQSTLRHEALFCAERAKMQNALMLT